MVRRCLLMAAVCAGFLLMPGTADAHVLLRDESKKIGAILHVSPADDPIAGSQSNLLFDIQLPDTDLRQLKARLEITDVEGQRVRMPVTLSGSSGGVDYTFPVQGAYQLKMTVESSDATYVFNYAQRVTRGVSGSALDNQSYAWAEAVLVGCGVLMMLLLILYLNNRYAIAAQSKL